MKILIYVTDTGGLKTLAQTLAEGMKKFGQNVEISNEMDYENYDLVHILFDYSLFHPFGLRIIPMLIKLRKKDKDIVITIGTIAPKKKLYARNKFFTLLKKIILPIATKLMARLSDRFIVMLPSMKRSLIRDYKINKNKIEVIPHGMY